MPLDCITRTAGEWWEVWLELLPFSDLASDVYLLFVVWQETSIKPPSSVDTCEEISLWYVALVFTVIGTLVDLMPEALLLTEIMANPCLLMPSEMSKTLKLFISDGKPIVAFAASQDTPGERLSGRINQQYVSDSLDQGFNEQLSESLMNIRCFLRKRLATIAASLSMRDGCGGRNDAVWTYSGLIGILVAGEILTAMGAGLFLYLEPNWPAGVSLAGSIVALLASTRKHMRDVRHTQFQAHDWGEGRQGLLLRYLVPGPLFLVRYLLLVPVWPLILTTTGVMPPEFGSSLSMWVWPPDWLYVRMRTVDFRFGNVKNAYRDRGDLDLVLLMIAPHLLWTLLEFVVWSVYTVWSLCAFYFAVDGTFREFVNPVRIPWEETFAQPSSRLHTMFGRLQGSLGLGLTRHIIKMYWGPPLWIALNVAIIVYSITVGERMCASVGWVFVYSHLAWMAIMYMGHVHRSCNCFMIGEGECFRRRVVPEESDLPLRRSGIRAW